MSDLITPSHINDLVETNRIVVRYYNHKKRIAKIEFTPKTLEEYLQHFVDSGVNMPHINHKKED